MTLRYLVFASLVACASPTPSDPQTSDPMPGTGSGSDGPQGEVVVAPSNAAELGGLEPTGLTVIPPAGTFDTDADCVAPSALGNCAPVTTATGIDVCVCRMDELTIGNLTITGHRGLAILAYDSVVIAGGLTVAPGAGGAVVYATPAAGLGGGAGGTHATIGGGSQLPALGTPELVPLVGGMAGQDACGAHGGAGGGALQITAGSSISVTGTISAGGGGGRGGAGGGTCLGGGGGGAGGAVLLEAPDVTVTGTVAANGGGGGGGGSNEYGSGGAGRDGDLAGGATGGGGNSGHGCPLYGYTSGGWGGAGSSLGGGGALGGGSDYISGCTGGTTYVGAGGGGGGGGRIRVNADHGCKCGGMFSPQPTFGVVART